MPSVSPTSYNKDFGRNGDPRVNKALAIKLENPEMSLYDALRLGGFSYGCDRNSAVDSDGVSLSQRKNNLTRRLRQARKNKNLLEKRDTSAKKNDRLVGNETPQVAPIPCEFVISPEQRHPNSYYNTGLQTNSILPSLLGPDDEMLEKLAGINSNTNETQDDDLLLSSKTDIIEPISESQQGPAPSSLQRGRFWQPPCRDRDDATSPPNESNDLSEPLLGCYRKSNGWVVNDSQQLDAADNHDIQQTVGGLSDEHLLPCHADDFVWEPTELCSENDDDQDETGLLLEESITAETTAKFELHEDTNDETMFARQHRSGKRMISESTIESHRDEVDTELKIGSKRPRTEEHVLLCHDEESSSSRLAAMTATTTTARHLLERRMVDDRTANPWPTLAPRPCMLEKDDWSTTTALEADHSNVHKETPTCVDRKLKMALDLYRTEKRALNQRCMLLAGYSPAEIKESTSSNLAFAVQAWVDEGNRLCKLTKG